eukprot:2498815-Pyramimonas_sp.AAC.2
MQPPPTRRLASIVNGQSAVKAFSRMYRIFANSCAADMLDYRPLWNIAGRLRPEGPERPLPCLLPSSRSCPRRGGLGAILGDEAHALPRCASSYHSRHRCLGIPAHKHSGY